MSDLRDQLERLRQRQSVPPGAFDRLVRIRGRRERNRRIAASVVGGSVALLLVAGAVFEWNDLHRATSTVLSPATVSRLRQTWTATVGPHASAPVVADGLVFVAADGRLSVFDVTCKAGPRCAPVWTAPLPSDATPSEPAVGDGLVVVSAGNLFAFTRAAATTVGRVHPRGGRTLAHPDRRARSGSRRR
jgi:hypothetical protein